MKKIHKILLPFATLAASTAVVVPCITSCSRIGLMGTHDMLNPNYIHHVLPSSARTIKKELFKTEYLNDVANNTDIIKDDILFTYAKALAKETVKTKLDFTFTRYFLYVDDIKVDTKTNEISMHLWVEVTAQAKKDNSGNYTYKLSKAATGLDADKYVKSLTAVVGAYITAPYTLVDPVPLFSTDESFKNMHGLNMQIGADSNVRVHVSGVADMSNDVTGANSKTEQLSIDVTNTIANEITTGTKTTGAYNLYKGLIPSVGKAIVDGSTSDMFFVSYYFKNIKTIDE